MIEVCIHDDLYHTHRQEEAGTRGKLESGKISSNLSSYSMLIAAQEVCFVVFLSQLGVVTTMQNTISGFSVFTCLVLAIYVPGYL